MPAAGGKNPRVNPRVVTLGSTLGSEIRKKSLKLSALVCKREGPFPVVPDKSETVFNSKPVSKLYFFVI